MSYNYYNYNVPKQPEIFKFSIVIVTALSMFILVLAIWYIWALDYRYSSERVSSKLLSKYPKEIPDTQSAIASDGSVNSNKTTASALITIRTKSRDLDVVASDVITLPIVDNCSPMEKTCVRL